jgi:hypothetical protein
VRIGEEKSRQERVKKLLSIFEDEGQGLTLVPISAQLELTLPLSAQPELTFSPAQPKLTRGCV